MDAVHCSEKTEAKIQRYCGKKQWTLAMVENYREEKKKKRAENTKICQGQNHFEERW